MRKILLLVSLAIMLVMAENSVMAFGPHTHYFITKQVLDAQDTPIARMCKDYQRQLYAGLMIPDITVLKYYENYPMGKKYRMTHNWGFERAIHEQAETMDEKCFAYGITTHLIQDQISHNFFVPRAIRKYWTPNWLIHTVVEGKEEGIIIESMGLELRYDTTHSMDILFEPGNEKYLEMVQKAIGPKTYLDVEEEAKKLSEVLGSFYDPGGYAPARENWFFFVWGSVVPVLSKVARVEDAQYWVDLSVDYTRDVYNNWEVRKRDPWLTPHGSYSIGKVDKSRVIIWMIPIGLLIGYLIFSRPVSFGTGIVLAFLLNLMIDNPVVMIGLSLLAFLVMILPVHMFVPFFREKDKSVKENFRKTIKDLIGRVKGGRR